MFALLDSPQQLRQWLAERGEPAYRSAQVERWVYRRRAGGFAGMSDLPAALRAGLAETFHLFTSRVAQRRASADGTEKLLLSLGDGQSLECVLLRDEKRHCTACVSTQVGCAMGCAFCASGLGGVVRNLTTGEILEQVLHLQRLLDPAERISHVVVMGMGEPLANLPRLLPALNEMSGRSGLGVSARRITVSTVGLPEGIRRLARSGRQYHLAVSLHAPDDALRSRLVPANRRIGIKAILAATDEYFQVTGRRVTFEYVLLAGVNDGQAAARRLAGLLAGRTTVVNLIPYNPVEGLPFAAPSESAVGRFVEILLREGLNVRIRRRKGERIDAACGQLRRSAERNLSPAAGL